MSNLKDDTHIKPLDIKYISMPTLNNDDTMDGTNSDGWLASNDLHVLIDDARSYAEEHDGEMYIYKCVPIRRVRRGKIIITKLGDE
jgi:hypothetical protein